MRQGGIGSGRADASGPSSHPRTEDRGRDSAEAQAKRSGSKRASATGGGSAASWRGHRLCQMMGRSVRAAMLRKRPLGHRGQRCRSRATRRRRDQRSPLLQPLYRRPWDPQCAIGAAPSEGVEDLPVGILFQTPQGHRTPGGIADEPFQLVSAVGGNMRIGMQGKAMHASTACAAHDRALTFEAKARPNATDFLTRSFAKGNAWLHRRGQRTGQLGLLANQRIMARGHRRIERRLGGFDP